MRTDIVVQNVASFRIDPAILARPDRRLVLITSAVNRRRLSARRREDVFAQIVVLESFQPADLTEAVRAIRGEQVDPPPSRLGPYAAWVNFAKHEGRVP